MVAGQSQVRLCGQEAAEGQLGKEKSLPMSPCGLQEGESVGGWETGERGREWGR